jgi:hypothetical protein
MHMALRYGRTAALGVLALAGLGACGSEGDSPSLFAAEDLPTAAEANDESTEARSFIDRARAEFVVRPEIDPATLEGVQATQAPLLPPSEVDRFVREGDSLVPHFDDRVATAHLHIADRASGGFRVESVKSSVAVSVRLDGAADAPAEVGHGHVVFRDGLGQGTDIIHRAGADGLEDFVRFEQAPAEAALVYELELGEAVAGLRVAGDALEVLDASGVPRIRVSPPSVVDADGTWHWAALSVEGCAVDTNPLPPQRRRTTPPGSERCRLRVDWSARDVIYPALVDPNFWTNSDALDTARYAHVAVRITGDDVLVAGGLNSSFVALSSAEIWDSATDSWSYTGSPMNHTRYSFAGLATAPATATVVLLAGGFSTNCTVNPCDKSERYDTAAGTFGNLATMSAGRANFGMSLLSSGTQILVSGGQDSATQPLATAELHTISSNGWAATGPMSAARYLHTSTGLAGSVVALVAGGRNATTALTSAEKWSGGTWSSAGSMAGARYAHTASLLSGDQVMVAGGVNIVSTGVCMNRPEKWSSPSTWTALNTMTGGSRCFHAAATLSDGFVLVSGGSSSFGGATLNTATLYNTGTLLWSAMPNMGTSRAIHTATLYNTTAPSKVLIAGGANSGGILSACEFFTH